MRDTLKVPHGEAGKFVDVKVFTRENGDELALVLIKSSESILPKREDLSRDKWRDVTVTRVISRILPEEDMPFYLMGHL